MSDSPSPQQSNTLGNSSLVLSILSLVLVFGVGLCALTGIAQKWIQMVGTPLFICGGSSAFLGFLSAVLGATGLFGKNRSKASAMVGLTLGLAGICLFAAILILAGRSTP
jgi:hypothetical protein